MLGLLLPGCPLTDEYFVASTGGAAPFGAAGTPAGLDATGGTPTMMPGDGSANAPGDEPSGGQAGNGEPDMSVGGSSGTGGSASGTGGDTAGAGGTKGSKGGSGGDGATSGSSNAATGGGGQGGTPIGGSANAGSSGGGAAGGGRSGSSSGGRSVGGRFGGGGAGGAGTAGASAGGAGKAGAGAGGAGAGGGGSNPYQPACDDGVVKGATCGPSSTQHCYRPCGPDSIGFKSETCQQGTYVEQSGCSFPEGVDYSCYSIPPTKPAACPPGTPRATQSCQVATCTLCFGGVLSNPTYEDSTGTQKSGYCVCTDAGAWTCASTTSWPCPGAMGCE